MHRKCRQQGEPYHAPELCAADMEDICEWEAELRGEGPAAEDAYQIIRRESKRDWEAKHGDWHNSESMNARVSGYLAQDDCKVNADGKIRSR